MESSQLLEDLKQINDLIIERRILQARNILTKLINNLNKEKEKKDDNI